MKKTIVITHSCKFNYNIIYMCCMYVGFNFKQYCLINKIGITFKKILIYSTYLNQHTRKL